MLAAYFRYLEWVEEGAESLPDLEEARCIISSLVDRMIQSGPDGFELVYLIDYVAT